MNFNSIQKVFLSYLVLLIFFWFWLYLNNQTSGIYNYLYSFLFSLVPLIGGIIAMFQSKNWGSFESSVGKAVFFIGLGIFLWGAGSMVWSYYNFFAQVEIPYPSLADLGFAPSIFFYGLGVIYLSKATGAKFGLRNKFAKIFTTITPFIILLVSYYVLVIVARGGVIVPEGETSLKILLDIAYPLGDFIGLTIAIIISGLSFKYLGGNFKFDIYSILLGLGVMFIADTIFSYTTTVGSFYNADFGDLVLTLGLFLITFGVLGFNRLKED